MKILEKLFKKSEFNVAIIHDDFDKAQDRLLIEAMSIISSMPKGSTNPIDYTIVDKLRHLGFSNAKPVKIMLDEMHKRIEALDLINKTKKESELIVYYKGAYPLLKFLTVQEMDRLCNKYNLVHASVQYYIEDVPKKNIIEMENAQNLKIEDYDNSIEKPDKAIGRTIFRAYIYPDMSQLDKAPKLKLFICAPKSHFDLKGLEQKGNHFERKRPEPKDPIVYRYVRGGVQILTKWGLEASDESLLNEINN